MDHVHVWVYVGEVREYVGDNSYEVYAIWRCSCSQEYKAFVRYE